MFIVTNVCFLGRDAPPINLGGGGGPAQVVEGGCVCWERGGPTAQRETDLPQTSERQLICSGAKEGGVGDRASHLSDDASEARPSPHPVCVALLPGLGPARPRLLGAGGAQWDWAGGHPRKAAAERAGIQGTGSRLRGSASDRSHSLAVKDPQSRGMPEMGGVGVGYDSADSPSCRHLTSVGGAVSPGH